MFGAILGWLQIYRERHRDLWAFLVHRPLSRTRILLGKTAAGLSLYAMGAGLPLAGLVFWVSLPGHVLAPFEWRMAWPVTACFLAGAVYYLAGMLTGVRQARWYASRGLVLGLALAVSAAIIIGNIAWWIALGAVLMAGAVLAGAVRGSFVSDGFYRAQPALGKGTLVFSLTIGSFIVTTVAVAFLGNALRQSGDYTAASYHMAKDGTIYRWVHVPGQPNRYEDLNGEPAKDPKTGRVIPLDQTGQRMAPAYAISLDFQGLPPGGRSSWDSVRFFQVWRVTEQQAWFYWVRYGCLVGFDLASRRMIGALGPNGFTRDITAPQPRFRPLNSWNVFGQQHTLTTSTGVYRIDIESRTVHPLLTTTMDDPIGGATDIFSSTGSGWEFTLAASKRSVVLLTPDAGVVWKIAREPSDSIYTDLHVYFLEQTNQYAIWIAPSYLANTRGGSTLPTRVIWLDAARGEIKRMDLPTLPSAKFTPGLQEQLFGCVMPPLLSLVMAKTVFGALNPYQLSLISLSCAAICAAVGWGLGRRYAFSTGAQLGWALFHLVFGLPGFLAFLAVQEWPARESCPSCHQPRVVDREQCEHCGAPFAPPPATGTEIFEPLSPLPLNRP